MAKNLYETVVENLRSMVELSEEEKIKIICDTTEDYIVTSIQNYYDRQHD